MFSNVFLSLIAPRRQAALPIWRAIEIRCFKKLPARWSSCERQKNLQRCVMKILLLSSKDPGTSTATGWKMYSLSIISRFFSILRASAGAGTFRHQAFGRQ